MSKTIANYHSGGHFDKTSGNMLSSEVSTVVEYVSHLWNIWMEFRIPHLKGAGPIVNDVLHKLGASIALAWRWHDIQLISAKKVKMIENGVRISR